MILYDDKYNFLGMSAETLGFLGYEDLSDFLSLNTDVANLFVQKEGFIYNFDNFSWIDFVLFSGSANKSAMITLKNGQETKVNLSIKEVHLIHDLNGIHKIYGVKLISDHFHEISGVAKQEPDIKGAIGGFNLSGLTKQEPAPSMETKKTEIETEKESFEQLINETKEEQAKETPKSDSFVLNFAEDELTTKEEVITRQEETPVEKVSEEEFKLDFFKEEQTEAEEPITFAQQEPVDESEEEAVSQETVNDFLKIETQEAEETPDPLLNTQEPETQEDEFNFNLLKGELEPDTDHKDSAPITSDEAPALHFLQREEQLQSEPEESPSTFNFLHNDDSQNENLQTHLETDESTEETKPALKLDFLSADSKEEQTNTSSVTPIQSEPVKLDFLKTGDSEMALHEKQENSQTPQVQSEQNKAQIIQQIKDDIKEIDAAAKTPKENEPVIDHLLDIPKMPQVEQPLNLIETEEEINVPEKAGAQTLSNFQIEETKNLDTNRSFTSTLKSLFGKKESPENVNTESMIDDAEQSYDFKLKESEEEVVEKKSENSLTLIQEEMKEIELPELKKQSAPPSITEITDERSSFPSLSNLGLSQEEEFDLIADFITDAKESQISIEQFIETNDFDKINYSLVKIKSSAEILNLDAIIDVSNSMRKNCITKDIQKVTADAKKLKTQIALLEKHLEETAV